MLLAMALALSAPQTGKQPHSTKDNEPGITIVVEAESHSPFSAYGIEGGWIADCDAGLRIFPHFIHLDTTNSECLRTPYDTLYAKHRKYIFRLKPRSESCKFRVLLVNWDKVMKGWDVSAYTTEAAWRRHETPTIQCGSLY